MADIEKVVETPVAEEPVKKTRKPRAKKTETEAAPKKTAAKKAETEAAPKKTAAKKAETEAAPKKTAAKKTAAENAPKKTAAKKAEAEAAPKRTAAKRTAAPKAEKAPAARKAAAKKEADATVYIQFVGQEIAAKNILEAAKKAFAEANEGVEIKTIELYVKPEEGAAYYVVNGVGGDDMKIEL